MCIDKKSPIYNSLQPPICKIVSVFLLKSKIGHYYWQRKLMFSCILLFHSKIVLRNCWHTHFSEQEGNTRHTIKTELPFSQPNRSTPNQVYFILCVATTPQSSASEAIPHERQAKVSSQWSKSPAADIESHGSPRGFDQQIMQLFFLSVAAEFDFLMIATPHHVRRKPHIRIQRIFVGKP